jgi:uncharacterized membrane-anchored protein YitT (DUF2179 family)
MLKLRVKARVALMVLFSALVSAIGLFSFVVPGRFAPSGVDGIATMLAELAGRFFGLGGLRAGYLSALLNLPLLALAWFVLRRRYVLYTVSYMLLLSGFTAILSAIDFPVYPVASDLERFLAAIVGGIAQGITGLMLRIGGSAGGVDVVACMIQKKRQSNNVEVIIALLSYVIALFSFFVWGDINAVIFSFVAIYAGEKTTALMLRDSRRAIRFEIIVSKERSAEIKNMIIFEMKRGATVIDAKGLFLGEDKEMIVCLVHHRQFSDFMVKISKHPHVFMTYSEVLGIRGNFDWVLEHERSEDREMRLAREELRFYEEEP